MCEHVTKESDSRETAYIDVWNYPKILFCYRCKMIQNQNYSMMTSNHFSRSLLNVPTCIIYIIFFDFFLLLITVP